VLNVLIVGCGNIAGAFDEHRSQDDFPLTHAGAFFRNTKFNLSACVDPDHHRRREFMDRWSISTGFSSIDEVSESGKNFDIVSICSPTECHFHDLEVALKLNPELVFCEKPVTTSVFDTEKVIAEYGKAGVSLGVNYSRRWDPDIVKLRDDLFTGQYGQLRSIIGIYNKGILNNGSHMIDLLQMLVGPVDIVRAGDSVDDYSSDDPTIPVWLTGKNGLPVHLVCGNAGDFSIFELQFIFSSSVLTMEEGGMSWHERRIVDSNLFRGYQKLDNGIRREGKYFRAMLCAIDNIYSSVYENVSFASTGESALSAQRLCEKIKYLSAHPQ